MLRFITNADRAGSVVAFMLAVGYALVPVIVARVTGVDAFDDLIVLALCAAGFVFLGSRLPFLDWLHSRHLPRLALPTETVVGAFWLAFFVFACVAWITAPSIPIIAALSGADAQAIATSREMFLKARTGWQASFVYINALFAGALIPYLLAVMFLTRSRYRWLCFAFFFVYSISFVEKAFFFKAALPLTYLVFQGRLRTAIRGNVLISGIAGVLLAITAVSAGSDTGPEALAGEFFSTSFTPSGSVNKIVWRTVAIPVVTAVDGIRLFNEDFAAEPLKGATSTPIAALTGVKRVEFERLTFASQFGQNMTETGSANSVFFVEALINFGWTGVVIISLVIGLILRLFARTRDDALRAVWPLFAIGVYTSGLIGMLLSNGFIVVIPMALLCAWPSSEPQPEPTLSPAAVPA
ncbi:MAG TPA: hypothetical protein VIP11_00660 [Gemmatimonadaceae bacterium]